MQHRMKAQTRYGIPNHAFVACVIAAHVRSEPTYKSCTLAFQSITCRIIRVRRLRIKPPRAATSSRSGSSWISTFQPHSGTLHDSRGSALVGIEVWALGQNNNLEVQNGNGQQWSLCIHWPPCRDLSESKLTCRSSAVYFRTLCSC